MESSATRRPYVRRHGPETLVAATFVISRMAFFAAGGRFQIDPQLQLASFRLLKSDLVQTVWYLHTQPPLFNFIVGVGLNIPSISLGWSFGALYVVMGALLAFGLFRLACELGASGWGAAVAVTVISCSPSVLLYESWLTYDFLVAVGTVWVVLFFLRWITSGQARSLWGLCGCAGALVLIRALFVPPWFLLVAGAAILARRPSRKALVGSLVPLVLIVTFVVKDAVVFQQVGLSSWFGMNFSKVSIDGLPKKDLAALTRQGAITEQDTEPFEPYSYYAPHRQPCRVPSTAPAVLRQPRKPDGKTNLEYSCFSPVYRQFEVSAIRAALERPGRLIRTESENYQLFFIPSWWYYPLHSSKNGQVLHPWTEIYEHSVTPVVPLRAVAPLPTFEFLGTLINNGPEDGRIYLDVLGVMSFLATLAAGLWAVVRWVRTGSSPRRLTLVFAAATVVYVALVGNLFESGENMRFREGIEPLCLIVLAVGIDRGGRAVWRRLARPVPTVPSVSPSEPVRA